MTTLTEFLLARIAEDEATALAATPGPWVVGSTHYLDHVGHEHVAAMGEKKRMLLNMSTGYIPSNHEQDAEHIARHDPARVLAECAAKRRIVELHTAFSEPQHMVYGTITACCECGSVDDAPVEWPCPTLRALAQPHADRPDYREEFKP